MPAMGDTVAVMYVLSLQPPHGLRALGVTCCFNSDTRAPWGHLWRKAGGKRGCGRDLACRPAQREHLGSYLIGAGWSRENDLLRGGSLDATTLGRKGSQHTRPQTQSTSRHWASSRGRGMRVPHPHSPDPAPPNCPLSTKPSLPCAQAPAGFRRCAKGTLAPQGRLCPGQDSPAPPRWELAPPPPQLPAWPPRPSRPSPAGLHLRPPTSLGPAEPLEVPRSRWLTGAPAPACGLEGDRC